MSIAVNRFADPNRLGSAAASSFYPWITPAQKFTLTNKPIALISLLKLALGLLIGDQEASVQGKNLIFVTLPTRFQSDTMNDNLTRPGRILMNILEMQSHSLSEFFALIESQPGDYRHLFRGHQDSRWGLVPALYRIQNPNIGADTLEASYDFYEQRSVELFFSEGLPYLPSIQRGYSNDRILAQHFGVPTRFLDWTRDPLVALYFAVEQHDADTDAAVFMVLPDAQHLPEQVKSLGPHKVIALTPPAFDRRIPAQKSVFTFHPYGDPVKPFMPLDQRQDIGNHITTHEGVVRGFAKIIIPARKRRLVRHTLLSMGVDRRNLFPGLDGVGMDIGARARTGHIL